MDIVDRQVSLSGIARTTGPRPTAKLVRSIRRHGVLMPVLLQERFLDDGSIQYHIVDGNRRVRTALQLKHTTIPARVLQGVSDDEAARVTLVSNSLRGSNYITEFWAVKHLERGGVSRSTISNESGMSASMLATRDVLSGLDRRIFVGAVEGKIRPTFMMSIVRLPRDVQRCIGDEFEAKGRLLKRDIDAARKAYYDLNRLSARPQPYSSFRSMPEEQPAWFEEMPEPQPDVTDVAADPVQVEPPTPSLLPSTASPNEDSAFGPAGKIVALPVPSPNVQPRDSGSKSTPPYGMETGMSRVRSPIGRSSKVVDDDAPPEPPRHVESEFPAGESDSMESHVEEVPADLRMALRTVTQQAANRGVGEDAWIAEARSAYRRSLKQVSMTLTQGDAGGGC